ncbi:hypothetical protein R3P38DRAFT_2902572 [Favolaschia claudopus]|uniref:Uncharacterized protein n=1 Tax=Favolaschia claudopus TaxID=2862362 RepID=A0AAW0CM01_9AGAR
MTCKYASPMIRWRTPIPAPSTRLSCRFTHDVYASLAYTVSSLAQTQASLVPPVASLNGGPPAAALALRAGARMRTRHPPRMSSSLTSTGLWCLFWAMSLVIRFPGVGERRTSIMSPKTSRRRSSLPTPCGLSDERRWRESDADEDDELADERGMNARISIVAPTSAVYSTLCCHYRSLRAQSNGTRVDFVASISADEREEYNWGFLAYGEPNRMQSSRFPLIRRTR